MSDWFPGPRTGQLAMGRNWISIINAPVDPPNWSIPTAKITELITVFDTAQDIFLKASSDSERTPVVTAQCNAAFKALEDAMRFMKAHWFLVPPLLEADLISLGLKPDEPPPPQPPPRGPPPTGPAGPRPPPTPGPRPSPKRT
jgi:hypothetical protein